MSTKYFRFTDKPGRTDNRLAIQRDSDGAWRVAADGTFAPVLDISKLHALTEDPTGLYTFSTADDWGTDTYRGFYWRTSAMTDAPCVVAITLESDAEPASATSITAQNISDIADAVRDVSNAAPVPGSLGAAVNTAAAGGGGGTGSPSGAKFFTTND